MTNRPEVCGRAERVIGRAGGRARAAKLSPEERAEIARKAARARWHGHTAAPKPKKARMGRVKALALADSFDQAAEEMAKTAVGMGDDDRLVAAISSATLHGIALGLRMACAGRDRKNDDDSKETE